MAATLAFLPLTSAQWPAFVDLFGPERGGCAGCWCMWPRLRGVDFRALGKSERCRRFQALVKGGPPPGLLAFEGGQAVGWVAIGPRRAVHRFNIARNSTPPEPEAAALDRVWAITCFFVRNSHRGQGLMRALAEAAIAQARSAGAVAVDVCAIEPARRLIWGEGFVGVASAIKPLGFVEIARRSPKRPLLRLQLAGQH